MKNSYVICCLNYHPHRASPSTSSVTKLLLRRTDSNSLDAGAEKTKSQTVTQLETVFGKIIGKIRDNVMKN